MIDIVDVLRGAFILPAAGILAVSQVPQLQRFLAYGARASSPQRAPEGSNEAGPHGQKRVGGPPSPSSTNSRIGAVFLRALDLMSDWNVPHSFFIHFYILSVCSSILWAYQLYTRGYLFQLVAAYATKESASAPERSMSFDQLLACMFLLTVQGVRRLAECIYFTKSSKSKMWFVHWLVGLVFYAALGVAVWVEGIGSLESTTVPFGDASFQPLLPLQNLVFISAFIMASGIQFDCHNYLSQLLKYTLPMHNAFLNIISPHYTAECTIYLSLALLSAPRGQLVNKTMLSAFFFVVINLGVSADVSKKWYEQKFGKDSVAQRWRMIPGLF